MINRVYAIGFEGLKISSINEGKFYVEDAEAIKMNGGKVEPYYLVDERIKDPKTLLSIAKELLERSVKNN